MLVINLGGFDRALLDGDRLADIPIGVRSNHLGRHPPGSVSLCPCLQNDALRR
jgi:hypothetical protein